MKAKKERGRAGTTRDEKATKRVERRRKKRKTTHTRTHDEQPLQEEEIQ